MTSATNALLHDLTPTRSDPDAQTPTRIRTDQLKDQLKDRTS